MGSGIFKHLPYCPKCGVKAVSKDEYRKSGHNAYLCGACGFGFRVLPSLRHIDASALLKKHRAGNFVEIYPAAKREIIADKELVGLQKWLIKIGSKTTVRRSKRDETLFVFESENGVNHSTAVDYKRALSFMVGLTEGRREKSEL